MITAHIASIPIRENTLRATVESLASQVDEVYIALNGYSDVPSWLKEVGNARYEITDNRLGDAHKFMFLDRVKGIALTGDDDIIYSGGYVSLMVAGLKRHGGVVSLHGKKYPRPFTHFKRWEKSYHCMNAQPVDVRVDVPGSGVSAFDVSQVEFNISYCTRANIGDIFLGAYCAEKNIPVTVLAHPKGTVIYNPPPGQTIWQTTRDFTPHNEILKKSLK